MGVIDVNSDGNVGLLEIKETNCLPYIHAMMYFYDVGEFPDLNGREKDDNVFFRRIPALNELSSYFQHSNKNNITGEEMKTTESALNIITKLIRDRSLPLSPTSTRRKGSSPTKSSRKTIQANGLPAEINTRRSRDVKKANRAEPKNFIKFSDMLNMYQQSDHSEPDSPSRQSYKAGCNCNCHNLKNS